jgi:monoamine oxidase
MYNSQTVSVAIVGAGLAGLAAGDYLNQQRVPAQIYEASNRYGGRVFTYQNCDVGAQSFTDVELTILQFVERFNLQKIELKPCDEKRFRFRGATQSFQNESSVVDGNNKKIRYCDLFNYYISKLNREDDIPLGDALRLVGATEETIDWLYANSMFSLWGDGINTISVKSILKFLAQYEGMKNVYALQGGNDLLPKAIAKILGDNIHLNFPIKKIEYSSNPIRLTGPKGVVVEASKVIIAVPLQILKEIEFCPPLSEKKRNAIAAIPCTSCTFMLAESSQDLSRELQGTTFLTSDLPKFQLRDQIGTPIPDQSTMIKFQSIGETARETDKLDVDGRQHQIDQLIASYGSHIIKQAKYKGHFSWDQHPWAKGAYEYFPPGTIDLRKTIQEPIENTLFFSGGYLSDNYDSMNGALESGIYAAKETLHRK